MAEEARLKDGSAGRTDVLMLATGYLAQRELVRRALGDAVAEKVGEVWGIGPDGEMANVWKPTAQEGPWFMAGSPAQCRI